jgi:hypothetical protein
MFASRKGQPMSADPDPQPEEASAETSPVKRRRQPKHVVIQDMEHCSRDQLINVQTLSQWRGQTPGTLHNRVREHTCPAPVNLGQLGPKYWVAGEASDWVIAERERVLLGRPKEKI